MASRRSTARDVARTAGTFAATLLLLLVGLPVSHERRYWPDPWILAVIGLYVGSSSANVAGCHYLLRARLSGRRVSDLLGAGALAAVLSFPVGCGLFALGGAGQLLVLTGASGLVAGLLVLGSIALRTPRPLREGDEL